VLLPPQPYNVLSDPDIANTVVPPLFPAVTPNQEPLTTRAGIALEELAVLSPNEPDVLLPQAHNVPLVATATVNELPEVIAVKLVPPAFNNTGLL
jgi:hypothetical protein